MSNDNITWCCQPRTCVTLIVHILMPYSITPLRCFKLGLRYASSVPSGSYFCETQHWQLSVSLDTFLLTNLLCYCQQFCMSRQRMPRLVCTYPRRDRHLLSRTRSKPNLGSIDKLPSQRHEVGTLFI